MQQTVIRLDRVSKDYKLYAQDFDRVREILTGKACHQMNAALQDVSLEVREGEVVGVVGRNGAGKSTLLKVLANTLQVSTGLVEVRGRISALLELGASFHPEMSGHDNIYLYCSIQGLSQRETDAVYEDIVEFSGIREFIHRPVKTYSSGMFVRLAFAAATHVDPDILIIDEALSVGDGIFARRSFERILKFKEAGKTIFFCSHSLYQVEALCDRVIWMEDGRIREDGEPATVIAHYSEFLNRRALNQQAQAEAREQVAARAAQLAADAAAQDGAVTGAEGGAENGRVSGRESEAGTGSSDSSAALASSVPRILNLSVLVDGKPGRSHLVHSGRSGLEIRVRYHVGPGLPPPSLGVIISSGDGNIVTSAGSVNDGMQFTPNADGIGTVALEFPALALLRGYYLVDVYLMCERGMHVYEKVKLAAELNVDQEGLARGYVNLPHRWV